MESLACCGIVLDLALAFEDLPWELTETVLNLAAPVAGFDAGLIAGGRMPS